MRGRHAAGLLLSCVVGLSTFQGGCGGGSGGGGGGTPPTQVGISISPTTANVTVGSTKQFTAIVTGTTDGSVDWFVSGVMSGNNVVGTIDISGIYQAPAAVPNPANVTVKAVSRANSTKSATATVTIIAPPPPPEKIAFTFPLNSDTGDNIWTMNQNGTNLLQLTSATRQNLQPSFSPDGRRIAFHSTRDGDDAIYIMNLDGNGQLRLNTGFSYSTWPAWSPDGKKIAFIYLDNNEIGVAVIELATGKVTKLTTEGCPSGGCMGPNHPSWSPDGKKIVFDSPRTGDWDVYTMNADGSGVSNITNVASTNEIQPSWSPDGKLIAYISNVLGHWEIYVMNPDGTGIRPLTNTPVVSGTPGSDQMGALDPAWSPDSKKLVFTRNSASGMQLYTVAIDGSEAGQPLPNSPNPARFPAWAKIM